tara:strand:+ start:305 stop:517 length:213 start_codon:yes stop_codon:yes gene_type:complete
MKKDKYVLGFNHGYILMAKQPEVLDFLFNVNSQNEYILGLKDGRFQFYAEVVKADLKKAPKKKVVERKTK